MIQPTDLSNPSRDERSVQLQFRFSFICQHRCDCLLLAGYSLHIPGEHSSAVRLRPVRLRQPVFLERGPSRPQSDARTFSCWTDKRKLHPDIRTKPIPSGAHADTVIAGLRDSIKSADRTLSGRCSDSHPRRAIASTESIDSQLHIRSIPALVFTPQRSRHNIVLARASLVRVSKVLRRKSSKSRDRPHFLFSCSITSVKKHIAAIPPNCLRCTRQIEMVNTRR